MVYWNNGGMEALIEVLMKADITKGTFEIPAAFDTEATSFYDKAGKKCSLVYIWMFGIEDTVVYGRTLREFAEFIRRLNDIIEDMSVSDAKTNLRVYVHHLRYDFSHIRKYFDWDKVFLTDLREPLYAQTRHIRFQDSLILAGGKSLEYVGKHLRRPVFKAVGKLDYQLLRTPKTVLLPAEMHYCEQDVKVLLEYIREKMEDEGTITKIPYTNTGYVRRYVKEQCMEHSRDYVQMMDEMTVTCDSYLLAEQAFRGGVTGPNLARQHTVIKNVASADLKSAYPASIVMDYFPMSYFFPVTDKDSNKHWRRYMDEYCCLFEVKFSGLVPTNNYQFPLSDNKCKLTAGRVQNGRVISAAQCVTWGTELDYKWWARFYTWDSVEFTRFRVAKRGRLPKPIIMSVLNFFNDKTLLDGQADKQEEYMLSKNMLNSIYGMMVMKIVRAIYSYNAETHEFEQSDKNYEKDIDKYNKKYDRFLYYPWGVWVTAHTRDRLYSAIEAVGDDFLYCDTDAVYYTGGGKHTRWFWEYNARTREDLVRVCRELNIGTEYAMPKGLVLGTFEPQAQATEFKTIGPKRYMYKTADEKYHLTVAGTNKSKTLDYILNQSGTTKQGPMEIFSLGLVVPAEYAKRLVMTYIDEPREGDLTDLDGVPYHYYVPSGVHMEPAEYEFHEMTEQREVMAYIIAHGEEVPE